MFTMLCGKTVSLQDMMNCRENRVKEQTKYRMYFQRPVISFCMNIPGPIKTTAEIRMAFDIGCREIERVLQIEKIKILDSTCFHSYTGDEWILCVEGNTINIKELMTAIENSHPLGRLFDIDVIDVNGHKLSRNCFRKCLICNAQSQECSRNRKHSIHELQNKIEEIFYTFFN